MKGRFGRFGGQYVSEILMHALIELEEAFERIYPTERFKNEYQTLLRDYAGRPSCEFSLRLAEKLAEASADILELGGADGVAVGSILAEIYSENEETKVLLEIFELAKSIKEACVKGYKEGIIK